MDDWVEATRHWMESWPGRLALDLCTASFLTTRTRCGFRSGFARKRRRSSRRTPARKDTSGDKQVMQTITFDEMSRRNVPISMSCSRTKTGHASSLRAASCDVLPLHLGTYFPKGFENVIGLLTLLAFVFCPTVGAQERNGSEFDSLRESPNVAKPDPQQVYEIY